MGESGEENMINLLLLVCIICTISPRAETIIHVLNSVKRRDHDLLSAWLKSY